MPGRRRGSPLAAAGLAAVLAWPGLASAHAILLRGTPASGDTVPAGPIHIDLQFNSRIEHKASLLELQSLGGPARKLALTDGSADVLRAESDVTPGSYVLRWQVLALDGHLTRGSIAFSAVPSKQPAVTGAVAQ